MKWAFDAAAASYDSDFTDRPLARDLRARVWQYCDRVFSPDANLLELGCGTGEDAVHFAARGLTVTALDSSSGMLEEARRKIQRAGLDDRVELDKTDLAELRVETWSERPFDAVLSNFGVLNCLPDLTSLGAALAAAVRPGGRLILVLMGRFCPVEILALLVRGRPRTAFRRWRRPGSHASIGGEGRIRVWYPSPRRVVRELGSGFRQVRTLGLGTLLPPPDLAGALDGSPRTFAALARIDRTVGSWPFAARVSDHCLIDLERIP